MQQNIALHCTYTMSGEHYQLTTDKGDTTQLTDGRYTKGRMWTDRAAVGWTGFHPVSIVIDLQKKKAISGVSFRTVTGGKHGPQWPEAILVLISDDQKKWWYAGDLVEIANGNGAPPSNRYDTHRYMANGLQTWGRYVQLLILPTGRYVISDEIEVFGGNAEWVDIVERGAGITDVAAFRKSHMLRRLVQDHLRTALSFIRSDIADEKLQSTEKAALSKETSTVEKQIDDLATPDIEKFQAIVPMNDLENKLLRIQAKVWRDQGKDILRVWRSHRWDPLLPLQEPERSAAGEPSIDVVLMNNEVRGDVLNLTSAAAHPMKAIINITGLPGGRNPAYISLYRCLTTGTRRAGVVTAAMETLEPDEAGYTVTLGPGMTTQLWVSCHPENIEPGTYNGDVSILSNEGSKKKISFRLRVSHLRFPEKPHLMVSGWDYSNLRDSGKEHNALTSENRETFVRTLKEYGVNTTWATAKVMLPYQYGKEDSERQSPDTSAFDGWTGQWPDADLYLIYLRPFRSFGKNQPGSRHFETTVKDWGQFWVHHIRKKGLDPRKFAICIQDEPKNQTQFELVSQWAKAISNAAPEFKIFENPHFKGQKGEIEALSDVDIIAAHRRYWLSNIKHTRTRFKQLHELGKMLWFYSSDRQPRGLDPYTYYLGQAWHAYEVGATGSAFWSFADMRDTPTWNEFLADENGPFSPLFIDKDGVTRSKYMEVIREGSQDFEYLYMLEEMIGILEKGRAIENALSDARKTLASACKRTLAGMHNKDYYKWKTIRARHVADNVRMEVLQQLELLAPLIPPSQENSP